MKADDFYITYSLPVPGVKDRAACPQCGKRRVIELVREDVPIGRRMKEGKVIGWRYIYPLSGHFCTLRCANDYANKIIDQKKQMR